MITSDPCHNIGINGGCGEECEVFLLGDCAAPDEIVENMYSGPDKDEMIALYDITPETNKLQDVINM